VNTAEPVEVDDDAGRMARWLLWALHIPYLASAPLYTTFDVNDPGTGGTAPWWVVLLLGVPLAALQLRHSRAAVRGERPAGWPWTFAALLGLVYMPIVWFGANWQIAQMLAAASAIMLLPVRTVVALMVVIAAGNLAAILIVFQSYFGPVGFVFWGLAYAVAYPLFGAGLFVATRLVNALDELREARAELAATVVDRERVRVSRDLHDLVGQSLAAVSLKGDLAMRLLAVDRDRALVEIAGIAETARATMREMRDVVGGPVGLSLGAEVDRAVSLLDAAGVTTDAHVVDAASRADVEDVLSWAVREGATNVLRHSTATWCRITLTASKAEVRLEITNDGALACGGPGNGITGMTERAAAVGGSVSASREGDTFHLIVQLPEEST
jgi:two-component system sensor histidine kinase DesK